MLLSPRAIRLFLLGSLFGMAGALPRSAPAAEQPAGKVQVFVGTYTDAKSKGIYRFELDLATGAATTAQLAAATPSPSFLAIHPSGKFLYAANETSDYEGAKAGAVSAFALDPKSGTLSLLNQQSSRGAHPCHLVVDSTGSCVLVANYTGGNVAALPIGSDGRLAPASTVAQHTGSSANAARQKEPHAHSINLDAANRFAFAADLGIDKIVIYRFDAAKQTLVANDPASVSTAAGGGPRHLAFHPNGKFAYTNLELTSAVTALGYDAAQGRLQVVQSPLSTLPADFEGKNSTAEIQVHPSGKFLYVSNRGHDSLALFHIDGQSSKLTAAGHYSTGGKEPRNFGIDPTGNFVLACNQNSHTIVVFRIDPQTGALKATGHSVDVPNPVCVKMLPLK